MIWSLTSSIQIITAIIQLIHWPIIIFIRLEMDKLDTSEHNSEPAFTSKETQLEQLQKINQQSPLHFALRINGNYYISFRKGEFWQLAVKSIVWIIINILIINMFRGFEDANQTLRDCIEIGLITQNILYMILCFMDPGTLFQDDEENYRDERVYCMNCTLYRLRSTRHCLWCNRCVQRYDHHCSVFGKCIAKRNIIPFWLFIFLTILEGPLLMSLIVFHLFQKQ